MAEFMTGLKRSCYCGEPRLSDVGKTLTLCGWVQRQRDLGQLIFIDLRDRSGIVQLAFDESTDKEVFHKAFTCRSEYVLAATGVLRERTSKNAILPTGDVELEVKALRILAKSETPPFAIEENSNVSNETRLRYRFLDLRRPDMQNILMARHRITKCAHDYFDNNGFLEIETPDLIKSTPEGARDYLVPSRIFDGKFFALPQSPQLYKQLLMISGFDRYMQIARCFRDEDLRADRQPEFTQIDFEMSFVEQNDVMAIGEGFIQKVYKDLLNIDIPTPLRRMTWQEAMDRFGSDKPDLRFGMELHDVSDCVKDTAFKVFHSALPGGSVRGINLKGHAKDLSRKEIDKLGDWVKSYGAKGLAWTRLADKETSSYEKFLAPEEAKAIREAMDAEPGDVLFLVASDDNTVVYASLGALRCELARRFNLIDKSKPCLLWVTDFPMFEYSKEEGRWMAMHHPFTMPNPEDLDRLESDPGSVRSIAYDMVINGYEAGGGSIRIHDTDLQQRMLQALGFTPEEAQRRFGFLLNALKYGAPPHGGMAWGLERLVMVLLGIDDMRDTVAFPKVASSADLMSNAPDVVDPQQLADLHIATLSKKE
ncbi:MULTISPECIES: aspartate--tRNA ligase [Caproicibacterium]|jgi:aspartyl-tRNA synthetase|uniref:Aspartate--tRNA ligase n=1 Tax=Caproicibacterium lactatifermentans TaxID=2666138 RepID=A0ABX6PVM1_9FIRM|nr:aspartate--tRNA ligase [Caproicibacterium lactatifermentans]ARP49455.1 aspartate--tRNA ligase [Ruminococcaceae bacterium CPB6]QKO30346.1 aspartate--tRNA ligase [Caproicibacterium lactatifermentans]